MKISCPVTSDYDIEKLTRLGIDEYFFGFMPDFWRKKYSLINSINRRYTAEEQLYDEGRILKLISGYTKYGIRFYMNLNSPLYTSSQLPAIMKLIGKFKKYGLSGIQVSDIGLILTAKKAFPSLKINVSCVAACLNSECAEFYRKLGAERIILERSLTIPEIKNIVSANSNIEFEAFVYPMPPHGCPNIDGLCTHHHSDKKNTPCIKEKLLLSDNTALSRESDPLAHIYRLYKAGVNTIKFPDRGSTSEQIINRYRRIITLIAYLSNQRE
mgnify:CR=1 FL=1